MAKAMAYRFTSYLFFLVVDMFLILIDETFIIIINLAGFVLGLYFWYVHYCMNLHAAWKRQFV